MQANLGAGGGGVVDMATGDTVDDSRGGGGWFDLPGGRGMGEWPVVCGTR